MLKNKIYNKISMQTFLAGLIFILLAFWLLMLIAPTRCKDLFNAYGLIGLGIAVGIYFACPERLNIPEVKIYFCFLIWVLLSRWFNGDVYLFIDFELVLNVLIAFLFFAVPGILGKKEREALLDLISVLYCGFFFVGVLAGLFVYITNTYIHLPPENTWISIRQEGTLYSLNLFSTMRLLGVARLFLAFMLFGYQFHKRKNRVFRFGILLAMAVVYIAIALCHSRTTQIAISGIAAMYAMLICMRYLKAKLPIRVICTGLAAMAALVLCYCSFDLCNSMVSSAHNAVAPVFEAYYNGLENKPNEEYFGLRENTEHYLIEEKEKLKEQQAELEAIGEETSLLIEEDIGLTANDSRKLAGNWTFTGRTEIWHAGLLVTLRDPVRLLLGDLSKDLMTIVNTVLRELYPAVKEYKLHMHNSYMQTLMLTGLPGLLLVVLWTVLLLKKMIKLFFSKEYGFAAKIPVLAIAGFLVIALSESFLFMKLDLCTMAFLLWTGIFAADYYDIFPVSK